MHFILYLDFISNSWLANLLEKEKDLIEKKIDRGPDQSGPGQHQAGPAHSSPGARGIQR
jgi:hypothetical protein